MPKPTTEIERYRPAIGVAVFNTQGKVWLGKRFGQDGPYSWQMPQGGMDEGETPETSAARELFEETGITLDMATPIGEVEDWLFYDFPSEYKGRKATKGWQGQRQNGLRFGFMATRLKSIYNPMVLRNFLNGVGGSSLKRLT